MLSQAPVAIFIIYCVANHVREKFSTYLASYQFTEKQTKTRFRIPGDFQDKQYKKRKCWNEVQRDCCPGLGVTTGRVIDSFGWDCVKWG